MEVRMPERKLRPEKSMQQAHVRTFDGDRGSVAEAFVEGLVEVVIQFTFEHDVAGQPESGAPSDAHEIGAGLGKMEIVDISAHCDVVLGKRTWRRDGSAQHEQQSKTLRPGPLTKIGCELRRAPGREED